MPTNPDPRWNPRTLRQILLLLYKPAPGNPADLHGQWIASPPHEPIHDATDDEVIDQLHRLEELGLIRSKPVEFRFHDNFQAYLPDDRAREWFHIAGDDARWAAESPRLLALMEAEG